MKRSVLAFALAFGLLPAALHAQTAAQTEEPTLRDKLMPAGAAVMVTAPAPEPAPSEKAADMTAHQPVMANGRAGIGYMIAGLALFVAGAVIDDGDAGTVLMLAGAGIGAYGLYLHFR